MHLLTLVSSRPVWVRPCWSRETGTQKCKLLGDFGCTNGLPLRHSSDGKLSQPLVEQTDPSQTTEPGKLDCIPRAAWRLQNQIYICVPFPSLTVILNPCLDCSPAGANAQTGLVQEQPRTTEGVAHSSPTPDTRVDGHPEGVQLNPSFKKMYSVTATPSGWRNDRARTPDLA